MNNSKVYLYVYLGILAKRRKEQIRFKNLEHFLLFERNKLLLLEIRILQL